MMERLNTKDGQKEVIRAMDAVRKNLTAAKNMVLFIATNVDKLTAQVSDVYSPWNALQLANNEKKK